MSAAAWWLAATAWASGFEVAQQGAAAAGTAHAGTALLGRAESAWFNPAALTDGLGFRGAVGVTLAWSRVSATSLPGAPDGPWSGTTDTPLGTPPYAYLSFARARWAVALSANVPFGGGVRWPEDWPQRFEVLLSRPQFYRVAGSFAYRVGPVSVGAGVHVDTGSLRLERATDHVGEEGRATILLRGTGVGGDAYVHARLGARALLAASYKSRTALPLAGEVDFDLPPVFATDRPDQGVTSSWTLPDRLALAFAWSAPRWATTVEAGLTLWGVNDVLALDFEDQGTEDSAQQNRWRHAVTVRAGAEARAHRTVLLRGGLYVDGLSGAPPPPDRLAPSSPDTTRLGVTGGVGVEAGRYLVVDAFLEPLLLLPREAGPLADVQARYQGWAVTGGVGVTVRAGRGPADRPPATLAPQPVPWTPPEQAPPRPTASEDPPSPWTPAPRRP